MRPVFRFAAASCVLLASLDCAPSPPGIDEQRLLAEPMWTLTMPDSGPAPAWFEASTGRLELVRCPQRSAQCRMPVAFVPRERAAVGARSGVLTLVTLDAGLPVLGDPQSGARLVPAWVVPAAGSRQGH